MKLLSVARSEFQNSVWSPFSSFMRTSPVLYLKQTVHKYALHIRQMFSVLKKKKKKKKFAAKTNLDFRDCFGKEKHS